MRDARGSSLVVAPIPLHGKVVHRWYFPVRSPRCAHTDLPLVASDSPEGSDEPRGRGGGTEGGNLLPAPSIFPSLTASSPLL